MTKQEKKEISKEILKEIMEKLEDYKEINFLKKLKGKELSFQFATKKDYGNEYYIRFRGEEYEEVSENYVKEVIELYCINRAGKIQKYNTEEGGILNIIYKAS